VKQIKQQFVLPTDRKSHSHYLKIQKLENINGRRNGEKRSDMVTDDSELGYFLLQKGNFGKMLSIEKKDNVVAEAIQRFWAYDIICNYALQKQKM